MSAAQGVVPARQRGLAGIRPLVAGIVVALSTAGVVWLVDPGPDRPSEASVQPPAAVAGGPSVTPIQLHGTVPLSCNSGAVALVARVAEESSEDVRAMLARQVDPAVFLADAGLCGPTIAESLAAFWVSPAELLLVVGPFSSNREAQAALDLLTGATPPLGVGPLTFELRRLGPGPEQPAEETSMPVGPIDEASPSQPPDGPMGGTVGGERTQRVQGERRDSVSRDSTTSRANTTEGAP